jgi:hypothetical protein
VTTGCPERSHAIDSGHGWAADLEIRLAHVDRPDYDVELIIRADEAVILWLGTHEHVYPSDATPNRPWTTVIVDAAAAIIRSEYTVERTLRWGHVARSHLLDNVTGRWL